ncbi:MAG: hypothetical protein R2804_00685 [Cyclobacteriaceae bacterium]
MVKNIIIAVLLIISLCTTVYAIYQQTEARRQESLALANARQAEEVREAAESAQAEAANQRAAAAAAMAEVERQLKQALEKCKY